MTAKFNLEEAEKIARHIHKGLENAARRALLSTAHRIVQHITTVVIPAEPNPPVDRSLYRAAWRAERTAQGAEVLNTLPYAPIIEWGARAENIKVGRKMIDALEQWIIRKRIGNPDEARQIAWAVAMKMKKTGIYNEGKGLRILEKALAKFPEFMKEEYAAEAKKEFDRG